MYAMRPIFAICLDDGRADYGITRPRLTFAGRFGIGIIVLAVGGMGVRNVYSQMVANSDSDSMANAVPASVIDEKHATTGSSTAKPQLQPQTIGLAPIGTTVPPAMAKPPLFAGSAPNSSITPGEHVQVAAEATPIDRIVAKLDEKPRVAKKKPVSAVQVYELPDGRQVTVRRPTKPDTAGFDPWGFRGAPWSERRVRMARPGPFGAPF
jgi:hypothetical protein